MTAAPPASDLDALLGRVRAFVAERCVPLEAHLQASDYATLWAGLADVRADARAAGLWNLALSASEGGAGLSLPAFGRVSEALGWSPLGHVATNGQAPDIGNMELLLGHATDAQKAEFLQPLLDGDVRSCFAMTEPEHAGSNPTVMSSTARLEGGEWTIDGHKWFTTGFDGAAWAVAMVVTDPDADNKYARASMILVPTDADGLEHVRKLPVMGDEAEGWFSHSEIRFHGVRVPEANLLGPRGGGFQLAQERLGPGRIHHCMRWVGVCERALSLLCRYAAAREIAPGTPLATKQAVQFMIAESRAETDAARLLVLDAAEAIERDGAKAARGKISAIKFTVANTLQRVLDRAIQVHGGLGVLDDTPLAFWYRHERGARIYDGPDEVHKTVVAREEMRRYPDAAPPAKARVGVDV
ncbi:acyl-CoA dehydrogenase family protein [Rubrivirga sp. S365]|uniref:Acyl-CoA dehydrogenase family protein n=1 Tax=Rubrivirga litoralis TaxID=3075598 RepID=A0ABU3BRT5_9BACT|nr:MULTISPECIES: acyl-CoA dehydrogenase family protein [unclassified Rubrivirga]MDT0632005.1 acyl-CoA dehydrogenase family protein [Rubrivirga sp. F394]MDT7855302.1 acyl-CoA dehydrogenase family protein [Rubrivirga sp. S365]